MSYSFTFIKSNSWDGVIHWKCEFKQDTSLLWIPVPFDDLLFEVNSFENTMNVRRPNSKAKRVDYPAKTILFGTRMPLNMFVDLYADTHTSVRNYQMSCKSAQNLTEYAKVIDSFLSQYAKGINNFSHLSERTKRRKIKDITGMSKTKLHSLFDAYDYLSTSCGYGTKPVTLTDSFDHRRYYDQPHFIKKFKTIFGFSPTEFFLSFNGLPEQLLTISYKYMPEYHDKIRLR